MDMCYRLANDDGAWVQSVCRHLKCYNESGRKCPNFSMCLLDWNEINANTECSRKQQALFTVVLSIFYFGKSWVLFLILTNTKIINPFKMFFFLIIHLFDLRLAYERLASNVRPNVSIWIEYVPFAQRTFYFTAGMLSTHASAIRIRFISIRYLWGYKGICIIYFFRFVPFLLRFYFIAKAVWKRVRNDFWFRIQICIRSNVDFRLWP